MQPCGHPLSGNTHRVPALLEVLGVGYDCVPVALAPYPAILARVEALDGFPPMVRIEDLMASA